MSPGTKKQAAIDTYTPGGQSLSPDSRKKRQAPTSRRRFLKRAGLAAAGALAVGAWPVGIEPVWVSTIRRDLPVPNLPPAWQGLKVALIADLHLCPWASARYLRRCMVLVAGLGADLVAASGDFIPIGWDSYGKEVAEMVGGLSAPLGTFACLGNHDFGLTRPVADAAPHSVAEHLVAQGVRLLRNEAVRLTRSGHDLWIAGVEDLWSGRLDPKRATADVPPGAARLVLCHNPDAAETVAACGDAAILSGHTHGGQVLIPFVGPIFLPVTQKERYEGLHQVGGSWLYINRGLGWHWRVRLFCRPEISLLTLRRAAEAGGGSAMR